MTKIAAPGEKAEAQAGRELRRLRNARGWSQESVAERMQAFGYAWHQTTVAKIEAGSRPLRVSELADLASLFGLAPVALAQAEPVCLTAAELRALDLTAELARIVTAEIIGSGTARAADVAEATARIHAIQHMIMAQAAARAYPAAFRLLGGED